MALENFGNLFEDVNIITLRNKAKKIVCQNIIESYRDKSIFNLMKESKFNKEELIQIYNLYYSCCENGLGVKDFNKLFSKFVWYDRQDIIYLVFKKYESNNVLSLKKFVKIIEIFVKGTIKDIFKFCWDIHNVINRTELWFVLESFSKIFVDKIDHFLLSKFIDMIIDKFDNIHYESVLEMVIDKPYFSQICQYNLEKYKSFEIPI